MTNKRNRGANRCSWGCLGAILGMGIAYALTNYLYHSGAEGRFPNGGHTGEETIVLASYFNAFLYGAPAGGLLACILGALLTGIKRRSQMPDTGKSLSP